MDVNNIPTSDKNLRDIMHNVFGGKCFWTGRKITKEEMVIDHVLPQLLGGKDSIYNYVITTQSINSKKATKVGDEIERILYIVKLCYAEKVKEKLENRIEPKKQKTQVHAQVRQGAVEILNSAFNEEGEIDEIINTWDKYTHEDINEDKKQRARRIIKKLLGNYCYDDVCFALQSYRSVVRKHPGTKYKQLFIDVITSIMLRDLLKFIISPSAEVYELNNL